MEIEVDLYRTVKPNELLTEFIYNSSSETVTLEQLLENVPPKLLGSFKLGEGRKEVNLLDGENLMESIPDGYGPEVCRVKRLADGGISCFNYEAHLADVQTLPPPVGDVRIETGKWYIIEAAETPNNATLRNYLTNDPNRRSYKYDGRKCAMFLSFRLAAGVHLPPGYESFPDDDPPGHWIIRKAAFDPFDAHYCEIGGGYGYGLIRDLVEMGWIFAGLKLKAGSEPSAYNASFDKDMWTLAAIIYEYFSCLSTEVLVNDATNVLSELSTGGYLRESFSSPKFTKMLIRVLNDLAMHCNEQELDTIDRFKQGLN